MSNIASHDKGIIIFHDYDDEKFRVNEIFDNSFVTKNFLPYCFERMYKPDEIYEPSYDPRISRIVDMYPYTYLPLNRRYKPIGIVSDDWVKYEDYPLNIIRSKKPFWKLNNVFTNKDAITKETRKFYMYNDGLGSIANYCARLHYLTQFVTGLD